MDANSTETPGTQPSTPTLQPAVTPSAPSAPSEALPPEDGRELSDGRVQILSNAAYKRIRESAVAKGRRQQIEELNAQAKEQGFESYEAMMLAATAARRAAEESKKKANGTNGVREASTVRSEPKRPHDKHNHKLWDKYERERKAWLAEKQAAQRAVQKANRRARELEDERDRLDARRQLELTAIQTGVKDIDFAVDLLQREAQRRAGEGPDEWEKRIRDLDEKKFFEDLRSKRPYLFGETVIPATTGPTGEPGGTPPKPNDVTHRQYEQGKFDARTASDEEYRSYLRKNGFTPPSI